jgi:hypothetical protein
VNDMCRLPGFSGATHDHRRIGTTETAGEARHDECVDNVFQQLVRLPPARRVSENPGV